MGISHSSIGNDLLRLTLRCREIDKRLAAKTGLSIDEIHCLSVIYLEKPTCVKRLSEMLEVNATRTSKLLSSLEQKGFVARQIDPADHRKEVVTLTDSGQREAKNVLSLYTEVGFQLVSGSSKETALDLTRLVQILIRTEANPAIG